MLYIKRIGLDYQINHSSILDFIYVYCLCMHVFSTYIFTHIVFINNNNAGFQQCHHLAPCIIPVGKH